ncbi:uncharacterized protein K444DRAFT_605635 [Hyaloscypha bicolor E]|uniref:Uncharacterized protein n=1 Tax=Hyaloscypha bicolor E TaxID=1095630 RepID=A0A2J6SF88_9HELO|nr:uncharacterized protein K444DRAFT_605635 [Hyaloscypha bicolor E]PMD49437.1 hypothetical protein K444DRAFT_605635 [Hyaloscypha bicolor E]
MSTPSLPTGLRDLGVDGGVEDSRFPAPSKQAAGLVNGTQTDVSSVYFSDKILITISQGGRLSQWIQVPLSSASPTTFDTALPSNNEDMLPLGHLTPKTLLGAGGEQRETLGHLYASQIANVIATRNPEESRTVVVGLGLQKVEMEREAFFDLLELLQKVM